MILMEETGDGSLGATERGGEEGGVGRGEAEGEEDILLGSGAQDGIHGGVGGAVSGNDGVIGDPYGEVGGGN
jgi:hypothetical protein